jgi:hypothetical protein
MTSVTLPPRPGRRERDTTLKLEVQRMQLRVEMLDEGQRDLDLLLGGRRELQAGQLLADDGVDGLQPLGALLDERLAQPHPGAQVQDVGGGFSRALTAPGWWGPWRR